MSFREKLKQERGDNRERAEIRKYHPRANCINKDGVCEEDHCRCYETTQKEHLQLNIKNK